MSENDVKYETYDKIHMAEYVNTEYQKWQEKYDILYEDEFNIRLLLQLRYDILTTKPEHTKTKLELIEMVNKIQSRLRLKSKIYQHNNIIYVDYIHTQGNEPDKVIIYNKNKMIILQNKDYKIQDYANVIMNMREENEFFTVYIDTTGYGLALYDALYGRPAMDVRQLSIQNWNK